MIGQRELQEIAARADAAAPGPWNVRTFGGSRALVTYKWSGGTRSIEDGLSAANGVFIAAARDDVPKLVEEVKRLRSLLAKEKARAAKAAQR